MAHHYPPGKNARITYRWAWGGLTPAWLDRGTTWWSRWIKRTARHAGLTTYSTYEEY